MAPEGSYRREKVSAHSQHARAIVCYLQKRGAWCARIRGTWGQRRGLPDILACWRGHLIAIEVKTGKHARLSPQQKREHEALRAAGATVLVGDATEVVRQLEALTGEPQGRLL
ncbi:MAG: hypothetical protein KatS3mg023_3465 [Armatimonadota bacterium]|nr:MAG: hypothetical protein KatS3mg023_3465 [Armatimonadota bacterium]